MTSLRWQIYLYYAILLSLIHISSGQQWKHRKWMKLGNEFRFISLRLNISCHVFHNCKELSFVRPSDTGTTDSSVGTPVTTSHKSPRAGSTFRTNTIGTILPTTRIVTVRPSITTGTTWFTTRAVTSTWSSTRTIRPTNATRTTCSSTHTRTIWSSTRPGTTGPTTRTGTTWTTWTTTRTHTTRMRSTRPSRFPTPTASPACCGRCLPDSRACIRCPPTERRQFCRLGNKERQACKKRKDCIPRSAYGRAAAERYFNECENYCCASDRCFDRATTMLGSLSNLCKNDLRGPDRKWCDEADLNPVDANPGMCDDLAFKIILRYPAGGRWNYHIATVVKTCEDGLCVIDPIGPPGGAPTADCQSPADWAKSFAGGKKVVWKDTSKRPKSKTKVYVELAPGDQWDFRDTAVKDPTDSNVFKDACDSLEEYTKKLCDKGLSPFPPGCGKDMDKDGIPDAYDQCQNTPRGARVNYCNPKRLGCARGEKKK